MKEWREFQIADAAIRHEQEPKDIVFVVCGGLTRATLNNETLWFPSSPNFNKY